MNVVDSVLTMEQLLAKHPWPTEFAEQKRVEWLWHFDLPGSPTALWRLIADTSRLNRALGVAQMHFEDRNGQTWGTAKNGGVHHEWHEVPWSWVVGQWITCTRIYDRGFAKVMYAVHYLQPVANGTRVYFYFGAIPRNLTGRMALRYGFPSLEKAYANVLPAMAVDADRLRPRIFELPAPALSAKAHARLADARTKLAALDLPDACVTPLLDWIATGDEADLYRIQIRERARVWRVDERELLRVALHATRLGVLTLSWDTICPHCRGRTDEHDRLGDIKMNASCKACQVDYEVTGHQAVEVTFHVHAAIRSIAERMFCSAEPATKDHVAVQLLLAPTQRVGVSPALAVGRYRIITVGIRGFWYLDIDDNEPKLAIPFAVRDEGSVIKAGPGSTIELGHNDAATRQCILEIAQWKDHAIGPRQMLAVSDFRDLFAEDFINADVRLSVGEQTLLFTDVVGSTAFYENQGDPLAFVEIKRHFDEVFALIGRHNGAVIKTIGDAVMATFLDPLDAVQCSAAIHRRFGPDRPDCPIRLRISLNTGPCIAVRLNATMDFFGGTVNVAAKLQALAETWQVAMSETTYRAPGVRDYLQSQQAVLVPLQYVSKAMRAPVPVMRWDVFASPTMIDD